MIVWECMAQNNYLGGDSENQIVDKLLLTSHAGHDFEVVHADM